MVGSYDRVIKVCSGCGEQDLIFENHSFCDDCLRKRSEKRREILKL